VKRIWDPLQAAGAIAEAAWAPRPATLGRWIDQEARQRSLDIEPAAIRRLAERLGDRVTEGDVDRRHLSRIASMELDKLALRHALDGAAVSAEDVDALVAEATPASVWRLTDAFGERRMADALAALDRLLPTTPEPVLLAALHRRVRDLLEVGDRSAAGEKPRDIVAATGLHPYVAEKLQGQAARWTMDELARALRGLLELDARVKNVPGSAADAAQRRLAFVLWVRRHAPRRQAAGMPAGGSVGPG
jgi:DNA polymerase-3 subunit delta